MSRLGIVTARDAAGPKNKSNICPCSNVFAQFKHYSVYTLVVILNEVENRQSQLAQRKHGHPFPLCSEGQRIWYCINISLTLPPVVSARAEHDGTIQGTCWTKRGGGRRRQRGNQKTLTPTSPRDLVTMKTDVSSREVAPGRIHGDEYQASVGDSGRGKSQPHLAGMNLHAR